MKVVLYEMVDVNHIFQMFPCVTFGFCIFSFCVYSSNCFIQDSESLFKNIGVRKIVYPKILTTKKTLSRLKRGSNDYAHVESESLYITLNRWTIKTNFNHDLLIPPNYVSHWIHSSKETEPLFDYDKQKLHECLPLKGSIEELVESSVLLTLCNNDIFGLINIRRKSFFLQPTDIDRRHILYETTIPYGLATIMEKYSSGSKSRTGDHYDKDPIMDNIIDNDEKQSSSEKHRCMALVIGNNGTRYIEVDSSLCANKTNKNDDADEIKTATNRKRSRRESEYFDYPYGYQSPEQPYRVTLDCFERQRNKRALSICDTAEYYNMSSDMATPDYIQFMDTQLESNMGYSYDDEAVVSNRDYPTPRNVVDEEQHTDASGRNLPAFRPPSRVKYRWAKMVVGVDFDVIRFHGPRTEHYVFTVFNIVSSLFKEISSSEVLRIVIMKMLLYPDHQDSAIHSGDMKYPLYSVNKWNREVYQNSEEKYDMAVWYTHFKINEEESTSPGPYMCQWQWSCLLIEDVGWLSAVRIAHGIGHLIGLTHDGDLSANNNCALDALLETTIMAAVIPAIMPNPIWSSCSKSEFEFAVRKYPCLEKPPLSHEHTEFFHGVFSLDEQCRIEFGDGWVFCNRISVRDPCKELWCNKMVGKRRSCMTRQTRTLEGTLCSRGKRCINQTCEDATRPGYVQDITSHRPQSPAYPEFGTTSYPPGYNEYSPGYPQYTTFGPSRPGDLESTTFRPPYGPGRPPNYPETTTYRPFGQPGYPETTTRGISSYPGYQGTPTYSPLGPPAYQGTTTYGPVGHPGYPTTSPYSPPGHQGYHETTTYSPSGYPNYQNTTPYNPPGHQGYHETTTFSPPGYPNYPNSSQYGRPGQGYHETTTFSPSGYPNYPNSSQYGRPGQGYHETTTFSPSGYPNYPNSSQYGRPGQGYHETTTSGPPGYPNYQNSTQYGRPGLENTTYSPPSYPVYPGATTYRPPGQHNSTHNRYPPAGHSQGRFFYRNPPQYRRKYSQNFHP